MLINSRWNNLIGNHTYTSNTITRYVKENVIVLNGDIFQSVSLILV
ncbi:MAG: hypothetical protein UZ17_ACD001001523 [Acidobacteria bacterium OLB17]|nr:MAG: hypothetical protein UZ17_ACD001001523 [Acidobacteria bacterium OLB17]